MKYMTDIGDIEEGIDLFGWYSFGDKSFDCPGEVDDKMVNFFKKNKKLPQPCNKCYKALIFWDWCYSKENTTKFLEMLNSLNFPLRGKFNQKAVVFYFREKSEMQDFLIFLEEGMREFGVQGKTQWRRACKEYQNRIPEYWINAKELKV